MRGCAWHRPSSGRTRPAPRSRATVAPGMLSKRLREAAVVAATLLSALDRGILAVVSPTQKAMSFIATAITGVAGRYVELTHVRAENDTLVRENKRLRAELTEMRRLAEDSSRYQR